MNVIARRLNRPARDRQRAPFRWAPVMLVGAVFAMIPAQAPGAAQSVLPRSPAIRMLVVKTETDAKEAVALYTSGMSFDRVVRERSIGPERDRGGYLGRVDVISLSSTARVAVRNTRPGKLTPIFPTEGGFCVIQVLTESEEQEEEARLARLPEALQALRQGTDIGRKGDLDGAVTLLRRAVELNPALVDAHFNLAVALGRLGRMEEAIASMQEVVRLQPNDFEAQRRLGNWLSSQGRHADAILHLERAAALEVNSQEVWLKLAQSYEVAGRPRGAVGAYRRVLGLVGQDDPSLLSALLRAAMTAEDGPAAVDAARRLRATRPGHAGLLTLGDALMLNGETQAAALEYRMAVALAPKSARAHAGLARALIGLGQTEPAAEHLLQAIRLEPSNPAHYRALSALYERTGRLDLAIVSLRDAVMAAGDAQPATQAEIAEELAALYDRADMRREAERERTRAKVLRSP